jgi:hypothetical protein
MDVVVIVERCEYCYGHSSSRQYHYYHHQRLHRTADTVATPGLLNYPVWTPVLSLELARKLKAKASKNAQRIPIPLPRDDPFSPAQPQLVGLKP